MSGGLQGWDKQLRHYVKHLELTKPVVVCGDMNVCHNDNDIWHLHPNSGSKRDLTKAAGLTPQERTSFGELLDGGLVDSFRQLHPDATGWYTWCRYTIIHAISNEDISDEHHL